MRIAKYTTLFCMFILILFVGFSVVRGQAEFKRLQRSFDQIKKDSTRQTVLSLMGKPDFKMDGSSTAFTFWEDEVLARDNSQILSEFRYETYQFFLPRIFVVGFGENDLVISKHLME